MSKIKTLIFNTTGSKKSRREAAQFVLRQPELMAELTNRCFEIDNPDHYKACWILEIIAYENLKSLNNYLNIICSKSKTLSNESAVRPLSKIIFLLTEAHIKGEINLNSAQIDMLVELSFDWLINDTKVATKVYAMRNLYLLGTYQDWVRPELKTILEKDYHSHSVAYKTVAREILKKLK